MNIELEHLSHSYDQEILHNLSLQLDNVHALGIIGASGCGKSTLMRVIAGMEVPSSGKVYVNGTVISKDTVRVYQSHIGFVFQKHNLFPHLSLRDNLLLILNKVEKLPLPVAQEKTNKLLSQFRLTEQANKKPNDVSGGQAQRASIARALCAEPEIVFLDEPTAALDPVLTNEVLDAISSLRENGIDFLFVTHELSFLRSFADYVIFMDEGNIVEHGPSSCLEKPQTKRLQEFLQSGKEHSK